LAWGVNQESIIMSSSLIAVRDDGRMPSPGPRSGGPTSRRSFTSAQKLDHLAAYEAAAQNGQGGAYLRRHGLYSSLISEWRRLRDAGVLAGKQPGEKVGRLSAEQAEIARLRRRLDKAERRLVTTEAALEIMGKAHDLLEVLTKRSRDESEHTTH
jgi:transposase-like protein